MLTLQYMCLCVRRNDFKYMYGQEHTYEIRVICMCICPYTCKKSCKGMCVCVCSGRVREREREHCMHFHVYITHVSTCIHLSISVYMCAHP